MIEYSISLFYIVSGTLPYSFIPLEIEVYQYENTSRDINSIHLHEPGQCSAYILD